MAVVMRRDPYEAAKPLLPAAWESLRYVATLLALEARCPAVAAAITKLRKHVPTVLAPKVDAPATPVDIATHTLRARVDLLPRVLHRIALVALVLLQRHVATAQLRLEADPAATAAAAAGDGAVWLALQWARREGERYRRVPLPTLLDQRRRILAEIEEEAAGAGEEKGGAGEPSEYGSSWEEVATGASAAQATSPPAAAAASALPDWGERQQSALEQVQAEQARQQAELARQRRRIDTLQQQTNSRLAEMNSRLADTDSRLVAEVEALRERVAMLEAWKAEHERKCTRTFEDLRSVHHSNPLPHELLAELRALAKAVLDVSEQVQHQPPQQQHGSLAAAIAPLPGDDWRTAAATTELSCHLNRLHLAAQSLLRTLDIAQENYEATVASS